MSTVHGRGRLTDEDRARIEELAAKKLTAGRIGQIIKKHPSTVQWFMYTTGLRAPAPAPQKATSYVRNGITVRRFSADEDVFIQALRVQDYTLEQIAEYASTRFDTHRSAHAVKVRLIMLSAREDAA